MSDAPEPAIGAEGDPSGTPVGRILTVNQVVAYNLARARRITGWTQEETATRLQEASGKPWTAATLSAAERSWETGRSREFNANELLAFSLVFSQPISYFFLPLPADRDVAKYRMTKEAEQFTLVTSIVEMKDLLFAAFPLRYPPSLVESVNMRLKEIGLTWDPSARVDRYDESEAAYEDYLAEQHGDEITFTFTPAEMRKTIDGIMRDLRKEVLGRLSIESGEGDSDQSEPGEGLSDPPF